jgi:hypothetical protein
MSMLKLWDELDQPPMYEISLQDLVHIELAQPVMKGSAPGGLKWIAVRCMRHNAIYNPPKYRTTVLFHQVYSDLPDVWAVTDCNGAVPFSVFRSERGASSALVERLLDDHPVEGFVMNENEMVRLTYIKS